MSPTSEEITTIAVAARLEGRMAGWFIKRSDGMYLLPYTNWGWFGYKFHWQGDMELRALMFSTEEKAYEEFEKFEAATADSWRKDYGYEVVFEIAGSPTKNHTVKY